MKSVRLLIVVFGLCVVMHPYLYGQETNAEFKEVVDKLDKLSREDSSFTEVEVQALVDKLDKLYRANTSYTELEMAIVTPNWERTLAIESWTEGMDKTFIYIKSPKKEKGTAFLRIDKEMWSYFPKINKVMRIPPSMMMSSWMGSDFTNDDLVKESTFMEDYTFRMIHPENEKPGRIYVQMTPKEDTITIWAKIILEAEKETLIPLQQVFYDEKGNAMRTMDFKDVKEIDGRQIPTIMEVIPLSEKKKGNKTTIYFKSARFDQTLPKDVFTLRNLQKKR